ncbi:MAG: AI-2E family transporter [Acetobacteraceae bacterium]|nr:AI-2E family transporter [Acetobacteraceae bacterium]
MLAERILMGLLLGGVALGCAMVLAPFLSAILWASILAFTTWPLYAALRDRLRIGQLAAAGVMVTITAVVVVLPLALAAPSGTGDVQQIERALNEALSTGLPPAPDWLFTLPLLGPILSEQWSNWARDLAAMATFFRPYFGIGVQFGLRLLLGLANGVLEFVLALFVAFFLYLSGETIAARLVGILHRIAGPQAERLIKVTGETVRGVVFGILGTAVVQGMLTFLGLWLAGVPRPALLAVVAGGLSVLPVGAPLVWLPAALWLLSTGQTGWGIFMLAWGAGVISMSDNFVRPYFIARGAKLPFLLTMLGVLGGALAFGLLGVFVGPVLLAVGFTLVAEWGIRPAPPTDEAS